MSKDLTGDERERLARQAADDLAAVDTALHDAGVDVHLAGGSARTDELEALAAEHEARTGQQAEAENGRLRQLEIELQKTQEFVRQLLEAGRSVDAAGPHAQAQQRRQVHEAMINALIARGGRVVILIHPDPNPKMNWPVPVGINGETIKIKRGVPTEIPVEFVGVLENARREERVPLLDGDENPLRGGMLIDQLSYPYSLLPGAQPEERLATSFRPVDIDLQRAANQPRRAA